MLECIDSDLSGRSRWVKNLARCIANIQALQVDCLVFYTFHPRLHLHHSSTTREILKPLQSQLDGRYAQGCMEYFCKKSAFDCAKWL